MSLSATLEDTDDTEDMDKIDLALELLEGGRGIILGHLRRDDASLNHLKTRGDNLQLSLLDFRCCNQSFRRATIEAPNGISIDEYKRKIERDLRTSVDGTRSILGFKRFQTAPKIDEKNASRQGQSHRRYQRDLSPGSYYSAQR